LPAPGHVAVTGQDGIDRVGVVSPTGPNESESAPRTMGLRKDPRRERLHHRRPGHPVVVDVMGDSLAWSLVTYLPSYPSLDVRDRTMLGCGIVAGPFRYFGQTYPAVPGKCRRWRNLWRRAVTVDDPDVVLVLVGRWETMDRKLGGRWYHVGDPRFDNYLRSRLDEAITLAGARGARVVLATEPYNRRGEQLDGSLFPEDLPARVTAWNQLLRRAASTHRGVGIVDLSARVSPAGQYTATVGGIRLRADGLHLTPDGVQRWIAPWLLPRLLAAASGDPPAR
jgi:hypothetical protein